MLTDAITLYSSSLTNHYQLCQVNWQDGHTGFREHKAGLVNAQDGRPCTATETDNDGVTDGASVCLLEL